MQNNRYIDNAVLIYFILLVIMVVFKMFGEINFIDIIYLISLLCAILKYILIKREL